MNKKLVHLIIGSLLHDIGKITYRTGASGTHSWSGWDFLSNIPTLKESSDVKECVLYHHARDLRAADLREESFAYITYVSDNIAAAGDRRKEVQEGDNEHEGTSIQFDKTLPLSSVFNILNGNNEEYSYPPRMLDRICYPEEDGRHFSAGDYQEILLKIKEHLQGITITEEYINSLLHLLEVTTSFVPSSTKTDELADISLFDHSKVTAAIASCLFYYLEDKNYAKQLLQNEDSFKEKDAFIFYSVDISGIQNFIYTISGTDALKSLRTRSLYIEVLLENMVDELLTQLGLSRCNLIYTGGGHAYLLLANTQHTKDVLKRFEKDMRQWLVNHFDISLYLADGYIECSSRELTSNVGDLYRRVGERVAINKGQRYTAEDIIQLNSTPQKAEERECRECKRSGKTNSEGTCYICEALIAISPQITKKDRYLVVYEETDLPSDKIGLPLPYSRVLGIATPEEIRGSHYVRVYSKNQPSMGYSFATNLWVGDYAARESAGQRVRTFEEMAEHAQGIKRIAVLRADVDNLGRAFALGFKEQKDGKIVENSQREYETLSRTATLSRHLSMFFQYYINELLENEQRNALIVYSGGDDMFIVGGWDDVIDVAKDVQEAFNIYTQGTLSISAGIGIYPHSYPISRIAQEVGQLESAAKTKDTRKNKITLFRTKKVDKKGIVVEEDWVLGWEQLPAMHWTESSTVHEASGIRKKLDMLRDLFLNDNESGKAFLYKTLELFRQSRHDAINIARYAYLLTRAKKRNPGLSVPDFYNFIKNANERKELEIAITLYSYATRNR